MDSRAKGVRGELEAAQALSRIGLDARRAQQYSGKAGTADLMLEADLHVEVKLTERLNPYSFMSQAIADSRSKKTPLVVMRSSYKPWLILCRLDDLPKVAEEVIRARGIRPEDQGSDVRREGADPSPQPGASGVEMDALPPAVAEPEPVVR
jgi:hypothetical protein